MTDDPIENCPKCGDKTHRVISGGAGFLFKGSGFYITDYRSKDYKSKADADKPSSTTSSTPPSTTASKPPISTPPPSTSTGKKSSDS